jgi:hypothetical protein
METSLKITESRSRAGASVGTGHSHRRGLVLEPQDAGLHL